MTYEGYEEERIQDAIDNKDLGVEWVLKILIELLDEKEIVKRREITTKVLQKYGAF